MGCGKISRHALHRFAGRVFDDLIMLPLALRNQLCAFSVNPRAQGRLPIRLDIHQEKLTSKIVRLLVRHSFARHQRFAVPTRPPRQQIITVEYLRTRAEPVRRIEPQIGHTCVTTRI